MASSPHAGSAGHYAVGRVDYPIALADALARELGLDGSGRLLDIGCGPGKFTLQLAPLFEQATGVDQTRRITRQRSYGRAIHAQLGRPSLTSGALLRESPSPTRYGKVTA
jgi:predicted TPR repeat methyltransferase